MTDLKDTSKAGPTSSGASGETGAVSRIDMLEQTVRQLDARLGMLETLVRSSSFGAGSTRFLESRGVLWKQNDQGGWVPAPYCPKCKRQLTDVEHIVFQCPKCKLKAPFKPVEMKSIIDELPIG